MQKLANIGFFESLCGNGHSTSDLSVFNASRKEVVEKIIDYIDNLNLEDQSFIYEMCSPYSSGEGDYDDVGNWPGMDENEVRYIANLMVDGEAKAFFNYEIKLTRDIQAIIDTLD